MELRELKGLIERYYTVRGLRRPDTGEALMWAATELAECFELELAKQPWVRNNPQDHPPFSADRFAVECGQAIMMLIVAAGCEGMDALDALQKHLEGKIAKHENQDR